MRTSLLFISIITFTIIFLKNFELRASPPGGGPLVSIPTSDGAYVESIGALCFNVGISNPDGDTTMAMLAVDVSSTAIDGVDFTFTPTLVVFPPNFSGNMSVCVSIINDGAAEPIETITLKIVNTTNGAGIGDSSILFTIYDNDSVTNANPCADVFITEYIHSLSQNSRAIEIYNPNSAPINLSNYTVQLFYNGSASAGNIIALSGTLDYNNVYVVATPTSHPDILAVANLTDALLNFTGDDAVGLFNGNLLVDAIGTIGQDPGGFWPAGNGNTASSAIVRNIDVFSGESDWGVSAGQWTNFTQDDFTHIGAHTINGCGFVVPPLITMITSDATFPESIGGLGITVDIDMAPLIDATVDVEVDILSSAAISDDFILAPDSLIFEAGSSLNQSFSISVVDDIIDEGDETVIIKLRNPSGAVLDDSVFVLTITDNDVGTGMEWLAGVSEKIILYPNPAQSLLNIYAPLEISTLSVKAITGNEVIFVSGIHSNHFQLVTEKLSAGIYTVTLSGEDKIITEKLFRE